MLRSLLFPLKNCRHGVLLEYGKSSHVRISFRMNMLFLHFVDTSGYLLVKMVCSHVFFILLLVTLGKLRD